MTQKIDVGSIAAHFESIEDPRHLRNRLHLLTDVLVISVAAVLCGCDGPTAIHRWAANCREWLSQHLALPNGLPSRDCIRRVLIAVRPEAFQRGFQNWVAAAFPASGGSVTPAGRRLVVNGGSKWRLAGIAAQLAPRTPRGDEEICDRRRGPQPGPDSAGFARRWKAEGSRRNGAVPCAKNDQLVARSV